MIWFGLLRGMKLNKLSLIKVMTGPDGYTGFFFKAAWNIVADDFVDAVKFFFISSKLLGAFNATTVTLIPNCANPSHIKEYRPISCCSLVYKCISKILVRRKEHGFSRSICSVDFSL
ncbi:hypothetical protein ERO13_D05G081450v2 [Gossypium hirsutum]|uniref:Uncharacterized protein n=3 Tax=Gossypium TaxID=3633 RepID=A0A5D2URU5_GOSMU|nr:hypothetical protein ERO13_D05G081450v2 [Gossypium hirsutum]TYG67559.1 hypothetical protein ES288_D05G085400v1 [Gossypium darwinii]TYH69962.1 hypothetical protein ES332_D05G086800v1 [Gossypium tomentosum]TYI80402.1 hypothetical protein E1A91_D05G085300v1 [Gossypium mustelinum]